MPTKDRTGWVPWVLTVGLVTGLVVLLLTSLTAFLVLIPALVAVMVVVGVARRIWFGVSDPDRERPARGLLSWFERGSGPWFEFADLPGEHMRWVRGGSSELWLVDAEGNQLARVTPRHGWPQYLEVGGRGYRGDEHGESWREFWDEQAAKVALTISGRHFNRQSDAQARLAGGPPFSFPVTGRRIERAVMRGVDDEGNPVMFFRQVPSPRRFLGRPTVQVVVAARPISDKLILLVAAASPLLMEYFELPTHNAFG